jgi:hypothetical protein
VALARFCCGPGGADVDGGGPGASGDGGATGGPGGADALYRAACLCQLGGGPIPLGTTAVLLLPWLFIAFRLARRKSR